MKVNQDLLFIQKTHVHEGLASGTIAQVALFMTKQHIYKIPLESIGQLGLTTTKKEYLNTESLMNDLLEKIEKSNVAELEVFLTEQLSPDWIFKVSELEKFVIQVGFWVFGKVVIKCKGQQSQTYNIQPKELRQKIKDFYEE